jgi:hypothetical protein
MKKIFFICALISFVTPLLLSPIEATLSGWSGMGIFELFPGISGLANQGNYPSITKIGMNIALLCSLWMLPSSIAKGDSHAFHKSLVNLSRSQRYLYAAAMLGLVAAMLFVSPSNDPNQVSSGFFFLVASNIFFLAIFTTSFFILSLVALLFPLILIFKGA